jgi:hypothetical protein
MICPECNGLGVVRKRFLLFFTRRARCRKCLGTGEFPPPVRAMAGYGRSYRDDDDDRWPVTRVESTRTDVAARDDSGAPADDRFEVGSGGRSGGGGAGASWDGPEAKDAPVIADPFASEGSSIVAAAVAVEAISSDSSSSTDDSSSSASTSDSASSDSGTSY